MKIADLALWDGQQQQGRRLRRHLPVPGRVQTARDVAGAGDRRSPARITPQGRSTSPCSPTRSCSAPGDTLDLTGKNPWIADDTAQADQHVAADNIVEAVNNDQSFVDLRKAQGDATQQQPGVATVSSNGMVTAAARRRGHDQA